MDASPPPASGARPRGSNLVALGLILVALAVAIGLQAPATPDGPSLARAKDLLAEIAAEPRPRGSEAHGRVRDALVRELETFAAGVEVQTGAFAADDFVSARAAGGDRGAATDTRLANVIARVPPTGPAAEGTGVLLLLAHYDSVVPSPGAGDDGSGTVAVVEALRAVASMETRRNEVIALITDGEEEGLRGARLFANEHPAFESVDVVLNFEAIGNAGPSLLFETGPDSGGLIELWADVAPEPRGNSLARVVYGWMPNDTDFSVFRDAGVRGLNFAIAGASGHYHNALDTPERFEDRALAHQVGTASALATRLAMLDLDGIEGGERTFDTQPVLGAGAWSGRAHVWLALVVAVAWSAFAVRRVRFVPLAAGLVVAVLATTIAACASYAVPAVLLELTDPPRPIDYAGVHSWLAAMVLCGVGAAAAAVCAWTRDVGRARALCVAGALPWFALFAFFVRIDFDQLGAAYVFAWGVASYCAASALALRGASPFAVAAALLPAVFELGPILGQIVQLSSQRMEGAIGVGSALIALGVLLLTPLAVPRVTVAHSVD